MVRLIHKTNIAVIAVIAALAPVFALRSAWADTNPASVEYIVNVAEVLTVTITEPDEWAEGDLSKNDDTGDYESPFLRNMINVSATTNNKVGVTVSMWTENTNLLNTTSYKSDDASTYIPTLTSSENNSAPGNTFPINKWGYSLNDNVSAYDADNAKYHPLILKADAVQVLSTVDTANTTTGSQNVFFGARANDSKQSGTYAQTVYFAAVTGKIDTDNPITPINPSGDNPVSDIAYYSSTTGNTTYTRRSTSATVDTTTTEVIEGDVRSTYAAAAGVSTSGRNYGPIITAFAVASAATATSGFFFIILAKRRRDDDDEEGEEE